MRYTKEQQQEYISQIRRVLVVKPESSILNIKEVLAKQRKPLNLDKDYINKLVRIIRKERIGRLDRYTINVVLAKFQDEIEELKKRLWIIITSPEVVEKDKIAAIRELRNSSKDLFDKMFDAGVFSRKLGELELGKTLSPEERDLIKRAIEMDYGKPKPKTEPEPEPRPEPAAPESSTAEYPIEDRESRTGEIDGGENKSE